MITVMIKMRFALLMVLIKLQNVIIRIEFISIHYEGSLYLGGLLLVYIGFVFVYR